jgi:hypothetical protein
MSTKGKVAVVLTVATIGVVGAAAGYAVAHGSGGTSGNAEAAATTSTSTSAPSSAPVDVGDPSLTPVTGSAEGADPESGQTLATDQPVTVTTAKVPVSVTFYGWNAVAGEAQVGGYVAGVVEDGGTCTLTLTKAGVKATAVKSAAADATTTTCGRLRIPGTQLSAGTWQAVLSYRSSGHTGSSDAVAIQVTA